MMSPLVLYSPFIWDFICGRRKVAVARYWMICLVLVYAFLSVYYLFHNNLPLNYTYVHLLIKLIVHIAKEDTYDVEKEKQKCIQGSTGRGNATCHLISL